MSAAQRYKRSLLEYDKRHPHMNEWIDR